MTLFRALRHRSFALLWGGQTLSRIGDPMYQVALAWWVLQQTESAVAMGWVLIAAFTPTLLFLPLAGVLVDRLPRLPLLLASDLVRGVLVIVVTLLAFAEQLQLWQILAISLLFGLVDAFFQPAYTALVPTLTPPEEWPSANALTSMSAQIGRVGGPLLGTGVIAWLGIAGAFAIDALTFLISVACLLRLAQHSQHHTLLFTKPSTPTQTTLWHETKEGVELVLATPILWRSFLIFALANMALSGTFSVALPFWVVNHLGGDVRMLGFFSAIFPMGYIIAGMCLGRLSRIRRRGWLIFGGVGSGGLMLAVFGLPVSLPLLLIAALLNGAALEIAGLSWNNLLQEIVPSEKMGRVASLDLLLSLATVPLSFGLAGWATDLLGPAPLFVIGGCLTALFSVFGLLQPVIRHFD